MTSTRFFQLIFIAALACIAVVSSSAAFADIPPAKAPPSAAPAPTAAPLTVDQLMAQAQIDAAAGHNDAAAGKLHRAVLMDPKNMAVQRLLGDVEYRLEDYKAAEAAYTLVLASDPANKDVLNRLGGVYAAEDRFDDAVGAFRRSLPSTEGFANLIQVYEDAGRLGELEGEFQVEETRHPFESRSYINLGTVYTAEKRYDAALAQLKNALDLSPRSADAHNELGVIYGESGRFNDAIDQQKLAVAYDPNYSASWMNWGVELQHLGDFRGAAEKIQHAIALKADYSLAYENLGVVDDYLGDFTSAIEMEQRSISLDPREKNVYLNLGVIYVEHNLFNLAEAAFIKGLAVHPRNEVLHTALGETYQLQRKFALAAEQFRIALAENPNYADARNGLNEVEAQIKH
jgi:tetratricopeptide (TPR) repeat protein